MGKLHLPPRWQLFKEPHLHPNPLNNCRRDLTIRDGKIHLNILSDLEMCGKLANRQTTNLWFSMSKVMDRIKVKQLYIYTKLHL